MLAALAACTAPAAPASFPASGSGLAPTGPTQAATLVSVTDGDTIRVKIGGVEYRVRYIGIDTTEIGDAPEPFSLEARTANDELLGDREITLEKDVSETDRFGRLLRYVWVRGEVSGDGGGDGGGWTLVNLELLRAGLARVVTFPPDVKYHDSLFRPAEREAREAGLGIWEP